MILVLFSGLSGYADRVGEDTVTIAGSVAPRSFFHLHYSHSYCSDVLLMRFPEHIPASCVFIIRESSF